MPGNVWRSKVDHLGASMDRCRERINEMVQEEKNNERHSKMSKISEQYKQEIYNNGSGTTVQISIKTKKPSKSYLERHISPAKLQSENKKDMNWDTLLSQDDRSDIFSPSKYKQSLPMKTKNKGKMILKSSDRNKRVKSTRPKNAHEEVEIKRFAGKTKSSIAKEKEPSADNSNAPTSSHISTQFIQDQIVRQLQLEVEKYLAEKKKLESMIETISNQSTQKDVLIRERDEKLVDMKTIVARLTGTNNDMLAILSTKVRLEESLKSLESANRKLMQDLETEKRRNGDLQAQNLRKTQEIGHLQKIVNDLRGSMNHHVQDVENVIEKNLAISKVDKRTVDNKVTPKHVTDSTFATVDLGLSTDHSSAGNSPLPTDPPNNAQKSGIDNYERMLPFDSNTTSILFDQGTLKSSEDVDDDRDSAIGNSESHSLMPGTSHVHQHKDQNLKGKFLPLNDIPFTNSNKRSIDVVQVPKVSLGEQIKALHLVSQQEKAKQQMPLHESQNSQMINREYRPQLNLSETLDSERLEITTNARDRLNEVSSLDDKALREAKLTRNEDIQNTAENTSGIVGHTSKPTNNEMPSKNQVATSDMGSGDKLMSTNNPLDKQPISEDIRGSNTEKVQRKSIHEIDKRKSKEEIDRLKLHREQQNRILEQQRKNEAEKIKADEYMIANQIKAASQNVNERVNDFLLRMKNDDKFQVSLSSRADFDIDKAPNPPSTMQMNFTGTTNPGEDGIHSPSLTESRFRQGLEDSLEYSAVSDT